MSVDAVRWQTLARYQTRSFAVAWLAALVSRTNAPVTDQPNLKKVSDLREGSGRPQHLTGQRTSFSRGEVW